MWRITFVFLTLVTCAFAHQYSYRLHPRPVGVVDITPLIAGGTEARPGQFPYQVSIQVDMKTNTSAIYMHICGGSILNENWILTAAHCVVIEEPEYVEFEQRLLVVAGEHDLGKVEGTEQSLRVRQFIAHPLYPEIVHPSHYDIALIQLAESLVFNERVQPIALPKAGTIPSGNSTVSGWGSIGGHILFPIMPDILQTADMPIVEFGRCQEMYPTMDLADTIVCAGPLHSGLAACSGDSGGPLVQNREDGTLEVIGVVSWGTSPCGIGRLPDVYTRVSAFIDFINEAISS